MARRKGNSKGKSTVNARKTALENAREKLKDDPGGTKEQQQQQKEQGEEVNITNMEATTTANTTTKFYNKTKLHNNNNNQNKTASTINNKKSTYREAKDTNETQMVETTAPATTTQKKLTSKQTKAAAKLAAQQQLQQQQNAKKDTKNQQKHHQQQQQNEASKKIIQENEVKLNKTIKPATSTTLNHTTAINANNTINTAEAIPVTTAAAAANISNFDSIRSNNRNNDNNSSKPSDSSMNSSSSSIRDQKQQSHQQQQENSSKSDNKQQTHQQEQQMSDINATSWNNSKYLHKKFKRLASTTENDVLKEAEKLRTTSMSSASSSVSSPPLPVIIATNQQQQQKQQSLATSTVAITKTDETLTNGVFNKQETLPLLNEQHPNNDINNFKQNQVLQQLVQQQQLQQQDEQQHVVVSSNFTDISVNNANLVTSVAFTSGGVGVTTSSASSSSTAGGGGRYKCPYCDLSCTKPSVLQKHIRAHTNERPYPCEICGIAFKTKSNLYKHCRSRSHAARQKGIEVSPDADDGLSDQDVDPELSNSSSEMFSRTGSPIDEINNTSLIPVQLPFAQHKDPQVFKSVATANDTTTLSSSISPASISAAKPTYLHQPAHQPPSKLPLGSPAAGTLPPAAPTNVATNNTAANSSHKQSSIDYKPYKPKFHNASLYATAKEAAAAAAVIATNSSISPSALSAATYSSFSTNTTVVPQKEVSTVQKLPESPVPNMNHHQHLMVANDQKIVVPSSVHLPPPPQQSPNHMTHHPSLSPSTQMKLNNHINSHQLQQLQQHQLQTQAHHHPMLGPPPPANALPLPLAAAAYYLGQPPGAPGTALLHASPHLPAQSFYNPVFASLHMMTPQQQQQFHHQLQIQQQHIQQQQQQQLQLTHSSIAANIQPPPPTQSPHCQTSPSVPQSHIKATNQLTNTNHVSISSSNNARNIHHTKAPTPATNSSIVHPTPQNPLHYLSNAATVTLNPPNATQNKNSLETLDQSSSVVINQRASLNVGNSASSPSALLQSTANVGLQEVTLNKEKLNEHINKLISQNEAIVENKELLLQKKYPKTLNRSRSFTNNNNNNSNISTNSTGSSQVLQTTTGAPPSESPTNAKLAQAIVQKQQLQQQQQQQQQLQQQYMYQQQFQQQQQQQQLQQMHKQRHVYQDKSNQDEVQAPALPLPLNGTSKHFVGKHIVQAQQFQPAAVVSISNPAQYQQHRTIVTITPSHPRQQSNHTPTSISSVHSSLANVPLNLSAKTKMSEECFDLNRPPQGPLPQAPPPATPRKRHSIEQPQGGQSQLLAPCVAINDASNSSNSNSSTPQPSTSSAKYPPNNSIIKNLLLNARGLAVPTGTGEDAVYICPLCSLECRTAEELKLHNSTYCQGTSSSANSPASSPSHKYFRSNSMSLNMPNFKILSKNPLSLAKLAWSQLKTKPSNLVLNRLSASVANTSKTSSTNTTSVTTVLPSTAQSSNTNTSSASGTSLFSIASQAKSLLPVNDIPLRFVDAPLPSPGPLLGKTPLVDYTPNESKSKNEEVIITKMHDDSIYSHANMAEHSGGKRLKFDPLNNKYATKRSSLTSGGDMQLLSAQELSKKEERYKRFTSSGGCMIPLSECDDIDKSPKMIRTPLLSGGSFQEVSPKKETKLPLPLMSGAQLTPKLSLGLSSSTGPQHFQFPPINQITAFNPLTLGLTEKVIPYVPGIPGPNSLQPQLPLAPPSPAQQQKQHLLNVPQASSSKQMSRTASPNRNQTPSPMNMSTTHPSANTDVAGTNKPTFGGVQNVPSEFNRAPPSANMRNVRNWQSTVPNLPNNGSNPNNSNSKPSVVANESSKAPKSFNFMRMADNLSPRKISTVAEARTINSTNQNDLETRHFNLEKMSREQLIIQQPLNSSKPLSPTNLNYTPLHVDTNVGTAPADSDNSNAEVKAKSKFLRPTSLPLRPGTFTPKRHHGITPTANTLPLISPETPRPSKECVQLYLNGNSYTYLGLKCSTKTFYCTLNCPQPSYVQDMHKLSMYSMWQQCAENNPHPLGLKPKEVMSLYDSRQKTVIFTMAKCNKIAYTLVAAQQTVMTPFISSRDKFYHHQLKPIAIKESTPTKNNQIFAENKLDNSKEFTGASTSTSTAVSQTLEGGYESHENYIYVRGRGRGKYVCSECGIRCKKPSMLKKHIRTHTDVRPYTCKHCNFSFKTKGNLTKHMQSKTHYKKCIELGLNPGPMPAEGEFLEPDVEFDQQSSTSAGGRTSSMGNGESDSDGDSSDNETESSNESDSARSNVTQNLNVSATEDNKSHLEHEAARCLLTLSMTPPIHTHSSETSMANSHISVCTVTTNTNVSSTPTPAIRRVISYTSPKPPFDYQKQEQYYSNPKEPKPKISNSCATSFETTPMDLTKPRAMEVVATTTVSQIPTTLSSNPGPVQTQAQIRDVIFGVNKNESGFLKTMISMSSKVSRNFADSYEENHHKLNEDMMLYDYRREQTLQYYKIKQTQLSRGMTVNPNVLISNTTPTTNSTVVSTCVTMDSTTVTSSSEVIVVSTASSVIKEQPEEIKVALQLPKIEIVEPQETKKPEKPGTVPVTSSVQLVPATDVTKSLPKSFKSSDESEETDEEPPSKKVTVKQDEKPTHNANLPAAILQPGTTDFSGVLSGGSSGNQTNSNQQPTRTVIVGEDGFTTNNNEILPVHPRVPQITNADGRPVCSICSKTFQKQSQLVLHMNIHYMERKYKCDPCGVSFRTQGHLQKHERSEAHKNKVIMTSTFGVPTTSNPRPFECTDCKIAFRIHGHLAKHLRSKTHVQKLECLQKLPFGTYAEIERAGISLTEIDTSDCENSLISLRVLAQKLIEKDPSSKLGSYTTPSGDNSNTGLVSQDSASEDGFTAAERAAATAIASLDNNSAANTPRRANSTSEDESIAMSLSNNLKRRLPGNFSNGEESDKEFQDQPQEKRLRPDALLNNSHINTASPTN